jgi:hypothetical protein
MRNFLSYRDASPVRFEGLTFISLKQKQNPPGPALQKKKALG